jgi:hypothetical protein
VPIYQLVTPKGGDNERPLTDSEQRQLGHERDDTKNAILTTYEGKVLARYEKNGYHDSDFYAIVETDEPGKFTTVCYASTRGWTYLNGAIVDATPDVVERYEAFRKDIRDDAIAAREARQKLVLAKDLPVRVIKGKNKDLEGVIGWLGEDQYKRRRDYSGFGLKSIDQFRIGIRVEGQKKLVFLNAQNVEILVEGEWVEPQPPGPSIDSVAYGFSADTWRAPQVEVNA